VLQKLKEERKRKRKKGVERFFYMSKEENVTCIIYFFFLGSLSFTLTLTLALYLSFFHLDDGSEDKGLSYRFNQRGSSKYQVEMMFYYVVLQRKRLLCP
jgi:hypothetical protein